MIEMPYISPKFTVDDIHKIREYHYEITKNMTQAERNKFYHDGAMAVLKEMEELKHIQKQEE